MTTIEQKIDWIFRVELFKLQVGEITDPQIRRDFINEARRILTSNEKIHSQKKEKA